MASLLSQKYELLEKSQHRNRQRRGIVKDGLFKTILYTVIGIGIMTTLMLLTSITTPIEGVYIQLAYGYLALFAGVAGAIPAAIVGFTGHVLFDLIYTDHLWISWALSTGALGFVFGFAIRRNSLRQGVFSRHDMVRFNVVQAAVNIAIFGLIAPTLDVLFYQHSTTIVFTQGWIASIINLLTVAVFGTITLKLYANYKLKKNKQ